MKRWMIAAAVLGVLGGVVLARRGRGEQPAWPGSAEDELAARSEQYEQDDDED